MFAHVQGLQFLDAVGVFGDTDAVPHGVVEVNQHAFAEEVVHGGFANGMDDRQVPQRCFLIGRVVVDPHVRILHAAFFHVIEEIDERLPFFSPGVCPERLEHGSSARLGRILDHPEQVLQSPAARYRVLPQGVSLEVKEDVSRVRPGSRAKELDSRTE
ncbi:hypothetical protein AHiyo8_20620 [Arthrobacter sp. Hiyo8]|nr:hypothetical protein AHiyo8_20620 [Arthrobacter sp. Hiyo8]